MSALIKDFGQQYGYKDSSKYRGMCKHGKPRHVLSSAFIKTRHPEYSAIIQNNRTVQISNEESQHITQTLKEKSNEVGRKWQSKLFK